MAWRQPHRTTFTFFKIHFATAKCVLENGRCCGTTLSSKMFKIFFSFFGYPFCESSRFPHYKGGYGEQKMESVRQILYGLMNSGSTFLSSQEVKQLFARKQISCTQFETANHGFW